MIVHSVRTLITAVLLAGTAWATFFVDAVFDAVLKFLLMLGVAVDLAFNLILLLVLVVLAAIRGSEEIRRLIGTHLGRLVSSLMGLLIIFLISVSFLGAPENDFWATFLFIFKIVAVVACSVNLLIQVYCLVAVFERWSYWFVPALPGHLVVGTVQAGVVELLLVGWAVIAWPGPLVGAFVIAWCVLIAWSVFGAWWMALHGR